MSVYHLCDINYKSNTSLHSSLAAAYCGCSCRGQALKPQLCETKTCAEPERSAFPNPLLGAPQPVRVFAPAQLPARQSTFFLFPSTLLGAVKVEKHGLLAGEGTTCFGGPRLRWVGEHQ